MSAVLCALAGRASAQPDHFGQGLDRLREMEDERAIESFELALKDPGASRERRASIYLYLGIAHANRLALEPAKAAFARALELDSTISPPKMVSPKIAQLFEGVRRQRRAAPQAVAPAATAVASQPRASRWSTRRVLGWSALGGAVLFAGLGVAFGIASSQSNDQAADLSLSSDRAAQIHDRAKREAVAANVLLIFAGVAAIGSAALFWLGGQGDRPVARVAPAAGAAAMQLRVFDW